MLEILPQKKYSSALSVRNTLDPTERGDVLWPVKGFPLVKKKKEKTAGLL